MENKIEEVNQSGEMTLEKKIMPISQKVMSFIITTHVELNEAKFLEGELKKLIKKVDNTFDPILRITKDKKALYKKPLTDAQKHLRHLIGVFLLITEQKRREDEAKRTEQAGEEQQERIDIASKKIAEILQKSHKVEEQIKNLTETLEKCNDDVEASIIRTQLELLNSKKENFVEKAQAKIRQAEQITSAPPPIHTQEKTEVAGLSYKIIKEAESYDKIEIIRQVAKDLLSAIVLDINEKQLKKLINLGVRIEGVVVKEVIKIRTGL